MTSRGKPAARGMDDNSSLDVVERFDTFEEYLASQLTDVDKEYLEDEEMARQIVELGYRTQGEPVHREDFEARKRMFLEKTNQKHTATKFTLASLDKDLSGNPFLQALANREEAIRTGRLTTIIFIRANIETKSGKEQEVSGYIDLSHRMKNEDFGPIFEKKKKLLPKATDLSFYNWKTHMCVSNSTQAYQVIADSAQGIIFKNRRDRRMINVNPEAASPGENTTRVEIELDPKNSEGYIQIVLYDHSTRRRL
jgi:hypothetical protein